MGDNFAIPVTCSRITAEWVFVDSWISDNSYETCMSPIINGSVHSDAIKIRNGIMFDFNPYYANSRTPVGRDSYRPHLRATLLAARLLDEVLADLAYELRY